ncbi:unnamed protein product, partial [Polarella glacialis]
MTDDSVAKAVDRLNDELAEPLFSALAADRDRASSSPPALPLRIVSFSHFVPRVDLTPEKRILFYPSLPKAIGSKVLARRVARLRPDLHVFGHTHFGWDQRLDGTRFVQAPLAMPKERTKVSTCAVGYFPNFTYPEPLLLLDGASWAEDYVAGWLEYYKRYPREPWLTVAIQADSHKMFDWEGKEADKPRPEDCFPGGRIPGWKLAPHWVYEHMPELQAQDRHALAERRAGRPRPNAVRLCASRQDLAGESAATKAQLPIWEVVGGVDAGGILVRSDLSLDSAKLPERLATGTFVEELRLEGERLSFRRLTGTGPGTGWVSVSLRGKCLLVRRSPGSSDSNNNYDKSNSNNSNSNSNSSSNLQKPLSAPSSFVSEIVAPEKHELWEVFSPGGRILTLGVRVARLRKPPPAGRAPLSILCVPGNPFEAWGSARVTDPLHTALVEMAWRLGLPTVRFDYRGGGGGSGTCENIGHMAEDATAVLRRVLEQESESVIVLAHSSGNTAVAPAMLSLEQSVAAYVNLCWGLHPKTLGEDEAQGQQVHDAQLEAMRDFTGSSKAKMLFVKGNEDKITQLSDYE